MFSTGTMLMSGCGRWSSLVQQKAESSLSPAAQLSPSTVQAVQIPTRCPVTSPTRDHPTDTGVFGAGPGAEWFCSTDNKLCVAKNGSWYAGGYKVGWRKPVGTKLEISGRRLDAEASPFHASVPDGYSGHFQASSLIFPTEGCWQVEAQADESTLHFVVLVEPPQERPRGGSCNTLVEAVHNSDGVIVGRVVDNEPDPTGPYIWHSVHPVWNFKHPYEGGAYTQIEVLQDTREAPALQPGHTYLLFLQRAPFQLFCPDRTLAEVVGGYVAGQVVRLGQDIKSNALWSGNTPEEVETEIKAIP